MGRPVSIKDALGETLRILGLEKRVKETGAAKVWPEAVGELIDRVTEVTAVRNGVVYVRVENSIWSQELCLKKVEIVRKLNERLGEKLITDIQFRLTGGRES